MNLAALSTMRSRDSLVQGNILVPLVCGKVCTMMSMTKTSQFSPPPIESPIICSGLDSRGRRKRVHAIPHRPSTVRKSSDGEPVPVVQSRTSKKSSSSFPLAPVFPGLSTIDGSGFSRGPIVGQVADPRFIRPHLYQPNSKVFSLSLTDAGSHAFYGGAQWFC
jgi:hypothetical protein